MQRERKRRSPHEENEGDDEDSDRGSPPPENFTLNDLGVMIESGHKQMNFIAKTVAIVCAAIAEQAKIYKKVGVASSVVRLLDHVGDIGILLARKAQEMDNGEKMFDDGDAAEVLEQSEVLQQLLKRRTSQQREGASSSAVNSPAKSPQQSSSHKKRRMENTDGATDSQNSSDEDTGNLVIDADDELSTTLTSGVAEPVKVKEVTVGDKVADLSRNYGAVGNMVAYCIEEHSGSIVTQEQDDKDVSPTPKMITAALSDANGKGKKDERLADEAVAGACMAAFISAILKAVTASAQRPVYFAGTWDSGVEAESPLAFGTQQAPLLRHLLRLAATKLQLLKNKDPDFILMACRECTKQLQPFLRQMSAKRDSPKKHKKAAGGTAKKATKKASAPANRPTVEM